MTQRVLGVLDSERTAASEAPNAARRGEAHTQPHFIIITVPPTRAGTKHQKQCTAGDSANWSPPCVDEKRKKKQDDKKGERKRKRKATRLAGVGGWQ